MHCSQSLHIFSCRLIIITALLATSFTSRANAADSAVSKWEIVTIAGTGKPGYSGDGDPGREAQINNPYGIARGPDGALYICDMDNHAIRRLGPDGKISTIAGIGKRGYSGDGGLARQAELNEPYEVRFDRSGNIYFVEMKNALVRRVDAKTQLISTVAGTGKEGFSGDGGPATQATMKQPHSIQFDRDGDLYICDIGNHRIRKVQMKTGTISTFAGTGERTATPDGAGFSGTPLNGPRAIDFDSAGNMWLALREGNAIYKLDMAAGKIFHVAGSGRSGSGNGGSAKEAALSGPKGISVARDGNIYFADTESHSIRRVNLSKNTIELVAGTGSRGNGPNGDPLRCQMARPHGVFVDADGSIYVGDSEAHQVRVIRPAK
jgi:streptogramin lyase